MYNIEDIKQDTVKAAISQSEMQLLYDLVKERKPEYVVETGSGKSSAGILAALRENGSGQLISIDRPDQGGRSNKGQTEKIKAYWEEIKIYYPDWTIYDEDILHRLPLVVADLPRIDFFFHDSLHESDHVLWEIKTVLPKMPKGGVVGMHDIGGKWRENMEGVVQAMDVNPDFEFIQRHRITGLWRKIR